MASFHHFKFENYGKRSNIDVKFSFDKDDTSSSCGVSEVRRYNRTRENSNQQRQLPSGGYEQGRFRNSPTHEDSESDCETDIDSSYVENKTDFNGLHAFKAETTKFMNRFLSSSIGKRNYKYMHKKRDRYERNYQKEITKFFKKNKFTKTVSKSTLKGPDHFFLYGLGSYFDGEQFNSQEQLSSERNRFSTFFNYTGYGNHASLARNGFYHDHNEGTTSTKCFRCAVRHSAWTQNDDVPSIHRRLSPNCTLLNRYSPDAEHDARESVRYRTHTPERPTERSSTASGVSEAQRYINLANKKHTMKYGNQEQQPVNLQESNQAFERSGQSSAMTHLNQVSNQTCITEESGYNMNSELPVAPLGLNPRESNTQSSQDRQLQTRNLPIASTSAVQVRSPFDETVNNPKHPDQSSLDARIRSYQDWQEYRTKTPKELAEAGFFFTGSADFVRCFCCGVGLSLRNWAAEDDPVEEHERWFPHCEYIRAVKEKRYIAEAQRRTSENMAGQQEQFGGRAEMITDTRTLEVVDVMQGMDISADHAWEALLAVRQQTGEYQVTLDQALNWFLDNERSLGRASTAEEIPSQAVATTCSQSSLSSTAKNKAAAGKNQEAVSAEAENQKLKELTSCKICMEQTMCITFLPCGHLLCCERCAVQVKRCPTCREKITGTVKTFMPL
ncbi:baculoviral IAP repeat-containing protein 3-like [Mercenaria mercenaria]|uniref:baculoviral IAP repeat-containing protein 3-like n=1 Tax=Mercenaria mercenaria TaxID=6596 RepID=UPI00234E938A|nr:baculoviral IAP repeat-containing protein 3-like [Mercenaria mercenaria]XP_053397605.1 baculoviral IAP repeat-containing protein 3-like [Mercenaria mercenaria]